MGEHRAKRHKDRMKIKPKHLPRAGMAKELQWTNNQQWQSKTQLYL